MQRVERFSNSQRTEARMRKLVLCLVATAGLAIAIPAAFAEDGFVGARVGGVGVGVDVDGGHHWRGDRYRTEGYDRREGFERCRTIIIRHGNGLTTRERRCRD